MATATKRIHKHFQLDAAKIKRAQKAAVFDTSVYISALRRGNRARLPATQ